MGISEITLYNLLRKKMGEQETFELMQFIHAEVRAELDTKTNVFLIKEDKIDLIERAKADKLELIERMNVDKVDVIERMNVGKVDMIERMNVIKTELIDRMNKNKTETLVWIVGVGVLQFLMILLTKMLR